MVVTSLAVLLVLVGIGVVVASLIHTNDYVLTPGDAQSVAPLIKVPKHLEHPIHGHVLLTDVYLSTDPVTLLQYLWDKMTDDAQFVAATTLLGPDTPEDQLVTQGYLEMAQSQAAAKATALTHLGYHVGATDVGVILYSVAPGMPGAGKLSVGQIIKAVDGKPTTNLCSFVSALHPYAPGDTVALTVEQSTVTTTAIIRPGRTVIEKVRLAARPASDGSTLQGCPGLTTEPKGYLGIQS